MTVQQLLEPDTDAMQPYQSKATLIRSRAELTTRFISPVANRLLDYWRSVCGDRVRPKLGDINLMDIYDISPVTAIRDAVDGGREFRSRYWGTGLVRALGLETTGKLVCESYPPESAKVLCRRFSLVINQQSPVRAVGVVEAAESRVARSYEAIWLSLTNNAGEPAHAIGAFDFTYKPTRAENAWLEAEDDIGELDLPKD